MHLKQIDILLADDDTDDCYFFKEALKEFAVTTKVNAVRNGDQLMEFLANSKTELPNVLFLDLNMPRKNGFECLAEIQHNERLKQLPIIIFSTSFHKKIAELLFQNGAIYYISKPSNISELRKAIQFVVTLISNGNISQPNIENFVLTVDEINCQKLVWFKDHFTIPLNSNKMP